MLRFLNGFYDYPVVGDEAEILPHLRDDFSRAVILDIPELRLDPACITDVEDYCGADKFWKDESHQGRGRKFPGEIEYTYETLTPEAVSQEALSAGLRIHSGALSELHQNMVLSMDIFSRIVKEHTQRDDFYMRLWQMWAPRMGQGRTPVLHIDRSDLTGLWYVARASVQIYTGSVDEEVWRALNPVKAYDHQYSPVLQDFTRSAAVEDFIEAPIGSLVITRNSRERNLDDNGVRRTLCIHRSGNVPEFGQAGIVMVPKFMD